MRQPPLLDAFSSWLEAFGDAWEAADADALAALFALGATMQPTPFSDLVRGRRLIGDHWRAELAGLRGVQFQAQVLGVGDTYGVAHWRVSFVVQAGGRACVRDGILLAAFDPRGQCTSLRQWWHERKT
ncbi:MAG: nuclear transport factor 2 family protein [Chloroflexota bacterium]|nr:nuclear transport factor 2 family protein [Chloroflexota bacterium]